MAIARVASQNSKATADATSSVSKAYPGNVTAGNLVVIGVVKFNFLGSDVFLLADISQSAGTATLGAWTLDANVNYNYLSTFWLVVALYSAPVTGSGSCTITVGGGEAGSYFLLGTQEYSGADVSGTRVAGSSTGQNATGAPTTGTVVSGGAGAFVGMLGTNTLYPTTHTPGADFTQIIEEEDGSIHGTGVYEDRLVSVDTTDAADWTAPTEVEWACAVACYKEAAAGGVTIPLMHHQYRMQRVS